MLNEIKKGDVYICNLDPVIGSEQGGIRPVIIVSNNIGNKFGPTVIIVPITSQKKNKLPTHIKISRKCGIKKFSIACCEQIRTIDKTRLMNKIGHLPSSEILKLNTALKRSVE